tara:strand:+ start:507 stop:737 length:231 start_codon:yes stop_codon:yes gene_type:complete
MATFEAEILHRIILTGVEWRLVEGIDGNQARQIIESELDEMSEWDHLDLVLEETDVQNQKIEDHSAEIGVIIPDED